MMPESQPAVFRSATFADVEAIAQLLEIPAQRGEILPRSHEEIIESVAAFVIAEKEDNVAGCVTLRDFGAGLYEIRSLVVAPQYRSNYLGTKLVGQAVKEAQGRGAREIFALTYHPRLFERLGFVRVKKERFPQKVWLDCVACSKRDHCDEIALLLDVKTLKA